ncbi:hypothetical protein EES44_28125 [Streptomyces sp. ADI96-15]|uniref:hypothetical protein n=1 Tax=Streptomyces sp. ADI96-15 TaxID=1522761 RepID=UPI000FB85BD0|nr:hypothetical protein EES44_28125 [Streptomyces sp. ADI96-15]
MGLFRRDNNDSPANPAMAELGREFAIARRHRDRKTMRRIGRQYDATAATDARLVPARPADLRRHPPDQAPAPQPAPPLNSPRGGLNRQVSAAPGVAPPDPNRPERETQ